MSVLRPLAICFIEEENNDPKHLIKKLKLTDNAWRGCGVLINSVDFEVTFKHCKVAKWLSWTRLSRLSSLYFVITVFSTFCIRYFLLLVFPFFVFSVFYCIFIFLFNVFRFIFFVFCTSFTLSSLYIEKLYIFLSQFLTFQNYVIFT